MEVMYRYIQILPTLEGRRLYKGKVPGDHLRILPMLFSYHGALALVQVLSIIYVCVCARARVCVTWERERTCVLCERLDHSDLWAELDWSVKQGSSAIASFYNMNILLCYLVSWTPCFQRSILKTLKSIPQFLMNQLSLTLRCSMERSNFFCRCAGWPGEGGVVWEDISKFQITRSRPWKDLREEHSKLFHNKM